MAAQRRSQRRGVDEFLCRRVGVSERSQALLAIASAADVGVFRPVGAVGCRVDGHPVRLYPFLVGGGSESTRPCAPCMVSLVLALQGHYR